ncbi:DUF6207 family protein [Streptomyces sp. NRRL S-340]|uniref:DUF6207 family protein n=1 Tax=Streptomyces sp. NRRL S-340 TaxID=1463901 RepID=UPI00099BF752|nr:DUF6207 family protein [Streptomyces sp. NRRL S-340]
MDVIDEVPVSEPGLVVVDVAAADDRAAFAFQTALASMWAIPLVERTTRDPGQPGVRLRLPRRHAPTALTPGQQRPTTCPGAGAPLLQETAPGPGRVSSTAATVRRSHVPRAPAGAVNGRTRRGISVGAGGETCVSAGQAIVPPGVSHGRAGHGHGDSGL